MKAPARQLQASNSLPSHPAAALPNAVPRRAVPARPRPPHAFPDIRSQLKRHGRFHPSCFLSIYPVTFRGPCLSAPPFAGHGWQWLFVNSQVGEVFITTLLIRFPGSLLPRTSLGCGSCVAGWLSGAVWLPGESKKL